MRLLNHCFIETFLTRPGDGEQFVYSPVSVNATLNCIGKARVLLWIIDGNEYGNNSDTSLNPRGIHFRIMSPTAAGITEYYIKVFGNEFNSNISICCQLIMRRVFTESCTILIIYGMVYDIVTIISIPCTLKF